MDDGSALNALGVCPLGTDRFCLENSIAKRIADRMEALFVPRSHISLETTLVDELTEAVAQDLTVVSTADRCRLRRMVLCWLRQRGGTPTTHHHLDDLFIVDTVVTIDPLTIWVELPGVCTERIGRRPVARCPTCERPGSCSTSGGR